MVRMLRAMDDIDEVLNSRSNSPLWEVGAYEALWGQEKISFKLIADIFRKYPDATPSKFVSESEIRAALLRVQELLSQKRNDEFEVSVSGTEGYPERLRDAENPVELLYFRGCWDLIHSSKNIAIVGSRNVSNDGARRTRKLVKLLVKDGYTIVSGLAKGVDTIAHTTAISNGGRTIAVIGTPITEYYPPENKGLQDLIAKSYLLVSQVPICRYADQSFHGNRLFFPERNITMSAIAQATVIVEASNTSGTLVQARAALQQGRKLFILDSCFQRPDLTWPARFQEQGAIRVKDISDIQAALARH